MDQDADSDKLKSAIIWKVSGSRQRQKAADVINELAVALKVPPKDLKRAMNELVFDRKLEYTYYGDSYIELPLETIEQEATKPPLEKEPSS